MKTLLVPSIYGIIAINEENELLDMIFQDLTPSELANVYYNLSKGKIPDKMQPFLVDLQIQGTTIFQVENPELKPILEKIDGMKVEIFSNNERLREIYEQSRIYFKKRNLNFTSEILKERTKVLSEFLIKTQISETATQDDFLVKQAVDTVVELDKAINFLSNRVREWYGLHFPELTDKLIDDNIKFAKFVSKIGLRANFSKEALESNLQLTESQTEELIMRAERSMGGKLSAEQFKPMQRLANQIIEMAEYRKELENYISHTLDHVAPNLKAVMGSQITGKLIAIAGSLERLAHISSSTLQMLGAEKALFKAIKSGGKTPKYGILFQWNKIRAEKSYLRGKVARMVAGKISILAKVDYYKGDFIGDEYRKEIDRKIDLLEKQFPHPPKKTRVTPQKPHHGGKGSNYPPKGKRKSYRKSRSSKKKSYRKKPYQNKSYQKSRPQRRS